MNPSSSRDQTTVKKTVVQFDLVGYSAISDNLEQGLDVNSVAQLNEQIQSFIDVGLKAVKAARDQTVMATRGDSALLVFDSATAAHQFSKAVHEATREHNRRRSVPLAKRIFRSGAATGEVAMQSKGHGSFDTAGMTFVRAARLEAKANPGSLLVDETTYADLTFDQKKLYGQKVRVQGKREEEFEAYSCQLNVDGLKDANSFWSVMRLRLGWALVIGLLIVVACLGIAALLQWPNLVGKKVVEMNKQEFDVQAARDLLRKNIEGRAQIRLADARKRNAPWREVDEIEKQREAALSRLDSLVESIQRGMTDKEADPVFREATTILAKQGIDEALAYLQAKQPSLLEAANREALARDAQEASLRRKLEPVLLQASLLETRLKWNDAQILLVEATKLAPQWWKTQYRLGKLLRGIANWKASEEHLRKALEFAAPDDKRAMILSELGLLCLDMNQLEESEIIFRQALTMDEQAYGTNHTFFAIDVDNLATLLMKKARFIEAEQLMRRALAINEQQLGLNHPEVATHLNNLGMLLNKMGRRIEAETLLRRSLAISEHWHGKEHPEVAVTQGNLATLLTDTGQLAEAETLLRLALKTDGQCFGPDHPRTTVDTSNLAEVLEATGRWEEAESLMRRTLVSDEKSYGKEHPNVAIRLNNLAQLMRATNRAGDAEPFLRRAVTILEKSYGPEDPTLAIPLDNLGALLRDTNRSDEGEPLAHRALRIFNRNFGLAHPDTQAALLNYKTLLAARGLEGSAIEAKVRQVLAE